MTNLSQAYQEFEDLWPSCVCAIVFLLLLLWDVGMAFRKSAHWVPGQALVLTALTIQMLGWISAMSEITYLGSKDKRDEVTQLMEKDQLLFDCGRLMMCVFIGYLLPAMVRANWTHVWSDIGGLILTVLFRLAFEVYFVWRIHNRRQSLWFAVSNTTLFMASSVLSLLLSCAVLAGKRIRSIVSEKVPWVLSCCKHCCCRRPECKNSGCCPPTSSTYISCPECNNWCSCPPTPSTSTSSPACKNWCYHPRAPSTSDSRPECKSSCCSDTGGPCKNWCCSDNVEMCKNTEDHVLKCWIVARVCQPEYIMARSVFSSLAGMIVTMAVVIFVVKWACLRLPLDYGIAHKTTIFIQFAFILIGWMVVSFRWFTAVLYFPRKAEFLKYLEDFWTRSIVDLKADLDAQLRCQLYKGKIIKQRRPGQRIILDLITTVRLHSILLPMRVWLQIVMVWLSKACWAPSQMLVGMIRPFIIRTQDRLLYGSVRRSKETHFPKLQKTLDYIRMPGEMARDLWTANEIAFKRTKGKMEQGIRKGEEDCAELIKLVKQQNPASLNRSKNEDENHFHKMSWKRKVVSLMYCMVHFYEDTSNFDAINGATRDNIINSHIQKDIVVAYKKASVINNAMKACSDAWDLLDFVDSSDNVEADKEFDNVRNMWQQHFRNLENLERAVEALQPAKREEASESENWQGALENWHGSNDWMSLTVQCNQYKKLYMKSYLEKQTAQEDQVAELLRKLAYVIHDCLVNELEVQLKRKCNKWAEEGNDEEIYRAAFIAGKAKGLRDKIYNDAPGMNLDTFKRAAGERGSHLNGR